MPKLIKHPKRPKEVNQLAHSLVDLSTQGQPFSMVPEPAFAPNPISEYMSAIGRKGGKIGGKRRLATMSREERRKVAKKAAKARWNKIKKL